LFEYNKLKAKTCGCSVLCRCGLIL